MKVACTIVQVFKCSSINVQVNVQVEVWNYDPLYEDECLDMIHEHDDVMIHDDALYDTNALLHFMILDVHTILMIHTMPFEDNLWWCSEIAKQRFFSNCGWQWAVCGSDIYRDDLTVTRVQRLSAAEFGMWQVHRFNNLLLIRVAGRGKEKRS